MYAVLYVNIFPLL